MWALEGAGLGLVLVLPAPPPGCVTCAPANEVPGSRSAPTPVVRQVCPRSARALCIRWRRPHAPAPDPHRVIDFWVTRQGSGTKSCLISGSLGRCYSSPHYANEATEAQPRMVTARNWQSRTQDTWSWGQTRLKSAAVLVPGRDLRKREVSGPAPAPASTTAPSPGSPALQASPTTTACSNIPPPPSSPNQSIGKCFINCKAPRTWVCSD